MRASFVVNSTFAAASILMFGGGVPSAEAALSLRGPAAAAESTMLRHLPAGREELTFRGENTSRSWSVFLSRAEAARTSNFQLDILNTVSLLPDRSLIKLTVNDHVLTSLAMRSPDKFTPINVKIPPGVLTPGANKVQISVALTHRVDCSVKATYELWAMLDPAKTGFIMEEGASYSIRSLEDIAAEPLSEDGTTRIHLRIPSNADSVSIARFGSFVSAIVQRASLMRPIVDVGPTAGRGPGFDVVLTDGSSPDDSIKGLQVTGHDGNVTLGRDPISQRLVLVLSGTSDADLDQQISELKKSAPTATALHGSSESVLIEAGARKTFVELGFAAEGFSGRHYISNVNVTLPADFYPASYDRARLLIDGAHSAALDENSELIFRVNGAIVSSMRLAAGRSEQFTRKVVELPMRFFHPGHNELTIEGITSSPLDQQCDLMGTPQDPRLTIAGTSLLEFPQFAHLGTLPQIPAALSRSAGREADASVNIYLPNAEVDSIGTAFTILSNMAATLGTVATPILHFEAPEDSDVPGMVIAPVELLPETLGATLRKVSNSSALADEIGVVAASNKPIGGADATEKMEDNAFSGGLSPQNAFNSAVAVGGALLKNRGFFFSDSDDGAGALPRTVNSLLIFAAGRDSAASTVGGMELPRFTRDPAQWLVVTAQSAGIYKTGVERLVATGRWTDLAGNAVSLDIDNDRLQSAQPTRVSYIAPNRFVLADIRPIFGGIVSNNITLSLGVLMLLMSVLGVSTHALIRRVGGK
jgi:cellulose synthase operon protein B